MPRFPGLQVRRRGFTLTEAIVALTLMTVGVLVFGTFFPAVSRAIGRAQRKDIATDACLQQIEYWRSAGYGSLPAITSGSTSTGRSFAGPRSLVKSNGTVVFTYIDGNFQPTATNTGRMRVDVSLSWDAGSTDRGSVSVTSLMTR